ncbi:MAG TPA: orotidine-5'-phosphate decarboxylase [Cryomorphaceae bacterium]|nr:orotidine-5'-phosphate decarboxylase [Owenweeksia sp.]HAD97773.1 orotidine-5'-phosphate decarboxylase [Cryomorphaceae bacterium]HBF18827.1 orotidine-5'-phosphate decarboxylase [Cryomorphaceae bacterium]HCQ16743.1 orotidine-5'-phosphate decarboxylase [Cryomorphaceae bacterium]|tara:strand:+ start:394 stop:1221 length:828 start_codon:yes stop_codon:yes gene_type:complete
MTRQELQEQIRLKKSMLCVGLDTDLDKIPKHLLDTEDPVFEFNKAIIDATHPYTVAYKPNTAFYEAYGVKGWQSLEKTVQYLKKHHPDIFTIADAKRGDIGNTSLRYAKAFLETMDFDSITVAPYMGSDSVKPFLEPRNKWVILLGLTSNPGATDFQTAALNTYHKPEPEMLYQRVLRISREWGSEDNMMYVVGATQSEYLKKVRAVIPEHFLLIPGVGAQGGNMQEVIENGLGSSPNLLINSSRGIIYASQEQNFGEVAARAASTLQQEMARFL